MKAADVEAIQIFTLMIVRVPAVMLWLRADERRLDEPQRERAWFPATRDLASFLLGSIALFWHYARTRRSWRGIAYGVGAFVLCEALSALLLAAEESALQALFPSPLHRH